ncbi:MAG: N-acetyltransferase family protein [Chloroflexota bacterium]
MREAESGDAPQIMDLIRELAATNDETSRITEAYVEEYLSFPGCGALVAEEEGEIVGLLSYSVRPNLYHAGDTALIEELVVSGRSRGKGIGSALVREMIALAEALGCEEISVSTMPDNEGAQRFYRQHGLVDEAVLLEKHL